MPSAWRIVKKKHAGHAFNGDGARLFGGRWTSIGRRTVYVSSTVALATLEMAVHLDSMSPLPSYSLFKVEFPAELVTTLDLGSLPANWMEFPAPIALAALGDEWLDTERSAVLKVPSAVVGVEFNYLLNPSHADFALIRVGSEQPYRIDPRLA